MPWLKEDLSEIFSQNELSQLSGNQKKIESTSRRESNKAAFNKIEDKKKPSAIANSCL